MIYHNLYAVLSERTYNRVTKPISRIYRHTDIDRQLYAKYHLTPDQISFIETMVESVE